MQRAIPVIYHRLCCVAGTPLQCAQDRISNELGRMAFLDVVVNVTPPVVIGNCVIRGGVSKYQETQPFGLAVLPFTYLFCSGHVRLL